MGPVRPRRSLSFVCFLVGFLLNWFIFGGPNELLGGERQEAEEEEGAQLQLAQHWQRKVVGGGGDRQRRPSSQQQKLDRPRFAQSELGIRPSLLVLLLARSAPVAPSLFALLSSSNVPVRPVVLQTGPQPELPASAQTILVRPGPVHLLAAIANQSLHNSANWFFFLPDSTFLNLFQLHKLLLSLQWNSPLALGHGDGHYCLLEGGILLSAPALLSLVQNRHLCHGLLPNGHNEDSTLETCIRLAANLSCVPPVVMNGGRMGATHRWWRHAGQQEGGVDDGGPIHDQIGRLSPLAHFNNSLTISPLLSERDVLALRDHFARVELAETEKEISRLERELEEEEEAGWPIGSAMPGKAPNRFQVPIWEMVSSEWKRFGNNPEENYAEEEEGGEWAEVVEEARRQAKCDGGGMRQGYRRFSPGRGMDFLVDLECENGTRLQRVQMARQIESTKLLENVPFVKEQREIAILVAVESADQVGAIRPLFQRILAICLQTATSLEGRQMRILVATRGIEAKLVRHLVADLGEMKRSCRPLESALLLLKPDPIGQIPIQMAAMDEAVDRFGQQTLFLLLPPFADFQADFLDRAKLSAIRHFQVFFPIPFVQFNHFVAGMTPREAQMFLVHKDRGRFEADHWEVAALFGADFARARSSSSSPIPSSLAALFLSPSPPPSLHILRPVDPSLRIRPHPIVCPSLPADQRDRCERTRRLGLGTRAQLARLLVATGPESAAVPAKMAPPPPLVHP